MKWKKSQKRVESKISCVKKLSNSQLATYALKQHHLIMNEIYV